jgi:hypothetical protein
LGEDWPDQKKQGCGCQHGGFHGRNSLDNGFEEIHVLVRRAGGCREATEEDGC